MALIACFLSLDLISLLCPTWLLARLMCSFVPGLFVLQVYTSSLGTGQGGNGVSRNGVPLF
jgi:hypothetical protein